MPDLRAITTDNIDADVVKADGVTLLLFTSRWSRAGRIAEETLLAVMSEVGDRLHYGRVDVDADPDIGKKLGVRTIPTHLFVVKGEHVGEARGEVPKLQLLERVSDVLTEYGAPAGAEA